MRHLPGCFMGRLTLVFVLAAASTLASPLCSAEDYPSRPIRFLQGFAPGGNADVVTRVLGEELTKGLGQPVVSESRPGAGGNLASEQAAKAAPDGYTIVLLTTAHVISAALYRSLAFDPVKDFEFVSAVSDFPFFFVVNGKSRFKTIVDYVAAARAAPSAVTFATAGVGTGQRACQPDRGRHISRSGDLGQPPMAEPARRSDHRGDRRARVRGHGLDERGDAPRRAPPDRAAAQRRAAPRHCLAASRQAITRPRRISGVQHARSGDGAHEDRDRALEPGHRCSGNCAAMTADLRFVGGDDGGCTE